MPLPADLPRGPRSLIVFRVVREGLDPLGTEGSLKAGGRYNPPNQFAALYTSLAAATAAEEVARGLRLRGIDPEQFPEGAYWVYELEVKLEAVLDLTDPDVLRRSGIQRALLTGADVIPTREIAAQARELGYQALLVPSAARPDTKNLVIFLHKLAAPPQVLNSRPIGFREKSR